MSWLDLLQELVGILVLVKLHAIYLVRYRLAIFAATELPWSSCSIDNTILSNELRNLFIFSHSLCDGVDDIMTQQGCRT